MSLLAGCYFRIFLTFVVGAPLYGVTAHYAGYDITDWRVLLSGYALFSTIGVLTAVAYIMTTEDQHHDHAPPDESPHDAQRSA